MDSNNIVTLKNFLGGNALENGCSLYLPKFSGKVELKSDQNVPPLKYPGDTFSERDVNSAHYITAVLGHVLDTDQIQVREPVAFSTEAQRQTSFLFGSRSNVATQWAIEHLATRKLFRFEFGVEWKIRGEDNQEFSLTDPSQLDRGSYESKMDYGVIGRLSRPQSPVFFIAGLGGRATEGCGWYFSHHWQTLYNRYGDTDFAVILRFSPPVNPKKAEPVAWYGSGAS